MELEATILERLQELRKWQIEQQERLLKQQQEQRELLSIEQDRMYQALGLSVQNIVSDDSLSVDGNKSPSGDVENLDDRRESGVSRSSFHEDRAESEKHEEPIFRPDENTSDATDDRSNLRLNVPPLQLTTNRYLNFKSSIDGFSPRSEIPNDREPSIVTTDSSRTPEKIGTGGKEIVIEGVEPLPADKPIKKIITLDDLPVPSPKKDFKTLLEERLRDCEANNDDTNHEKHSKVQIKRPFLKKGEGLARFKPNPAGNTSNRRIRPRSVSMSASMGFSSSKNNSPRLKETPKTSKSYGKNFNVPSTAQTKLNLKNVAPPKNKVRSKSICCVPNDKSNLNKLRVKPTVDLNVSSDMETKTRRELEEMRIFELLEEKAENSSFCSNSSTVLALFRQSTPRKARSTASINENRETKQRGNDEIALRPEKNDTSLEDIVRTTRSNMLLPGSPITKIRETVIKKDYVFSQWESDTQNDENINTSNANRASNRAIAAGTYKSTKHTTIQFNNNNNNNSTDDNKLNDSHDSDRSNFHNYNEINCQTVDKRTAENSEAEKEANVSLHVRFSEYNEYKTIGLTDTSIMSNDSNPPRKYMEDRAWSDRSTSPDSSDVEILFSNIGKKNTGTRISSLAKEALDDSSRNEQRSFDEETTTDQTTDNEDEDLTSICSNEESYDEENMTITGIKDEPKKSLNHVEDEISNEETENLNESESTIEQENDEVGTNIIDRVHVNDTIFKSELLKTRLAELEHEIDIFRKENAGLAVQRKKIQEEMRQLERNYKVRVENLEKERRCNEENLQEERKRLAREKAALENRLRDAREKSIHTKQERQEIQSLREQLDELRDDASRKESRWQAAQARQKSQIRVLQTENARLKQELEKIRASRTNNLRNRKALVNSNTKSIHQINKQLESKKRIHSRKDSSSDEERITEQLHRCDKSEIDNLPIEDNDRTENIDRDRSITVVYNGPPEQAFVKSNEDARKKRNMYTSLLNEATEGLRGNEEITLRKDVRSLEKLQRGTMNDDEENRIEGIVNSDTVNDGIFDNSPKRDYEGTINERPSSGSNNAENIGKIHETRDPIETMSNNNILQEPRRWSDVPISQNDRTNYPTMKQQDVREVKCPDGHLEYWYPNGNVKKIYPDRNVVKMIYYNGDVRETLKDGSVKYFYASTRTWHTTLPDGLEILEFPDGQVERRTKDGTNEVCFPDGSVRLLQADGTEKWTLPDGTIAETFPDGNKILSFPNGQREVHTKEHKRREYPDGTVKFVFPDGTQETRYSTGRIRVKDKDGNLIMDVQH